MSAIHRTHCKDCKEELTALNSVYQKLSRSSMCRLCLNKYNKTCKLRRVSQNPKVYTEAKTDYDLKRRYGISLIEYNKLKESQNGLCAICKNECSRYDNLSVDHCHETNLIRGLLCHSCNVFIGYAKSNILLLINAMDYLNTFNQKLLNNETLNFREDKGA